MLPSPSMRNILPGPRCREKKKETRAFCSRSIDTRCENCSHGFAWERKREREGEIRYRCFLEKAARLSSLTRTRYPESGYFYHALSSRGNLLRSRAIISGYGWTKKPGPRRSERWAPIYLLAAPYLPRRSAPLASLNYPKEFFLSFVLSFSSFYVFVYVLDIRPLYRAPFTFTRARNDIIRRAFVLWNSRTTSTPRPPRSSSTHRFRRPWPFLIIRGFVDKNGNRSNLYR